MRVLYLIPSFYPALYYGGAVVSSYELCNNLARSGVELRVLTTNTNGPTDNLEVLDCPTRMPAGYQVYYCNRLFSVSVSLGILWRMIGLIHWADVVHLTAVYSFPTIPALLICKVLNKPVVWSPRGSFQRWEGSTKPVLKEIWNGICRLVLPRRLIIHTTSEIEKTETQQRFSHRPVFVVQNGVEIPIEVKLGKRNDILRLLYLGRLDPIKAIENLLQACKRLNNGSRAPWSLTIAGPGEEAYTRKIKSQVLQLSLSDQVNICGEVNYEGREILFKNADVLILPSHQESFGMVVAEAMARSVPVLVSKKTPWHRVEEMGCGLWVDNDSESLAIAIKRLDKMPLDEMGRRGRVWMEKEFSWVRRADQMIDLYQKALSQ